eukprot:3856416-Amphidinium_carterae.1
MGNSSCTQLLGEVDALYLRQRPLDEPFFDDRLSKEYGVSGKLRRIESETAETEPNTADAACQTNEWAPEP